MVRSGVLVVWALALLGPAVAKAGGEPSCPRNPASGPLPGLGRARAHAPEAGAAARLNWDGAELYKKKDFVAASERYRAALKADPEYPAARLNLACALSRLERYAEAAEEAARLVRAEPVPWFRSVREATDLAALHGRRENETIRRAWDETAPAWGKAALPGVVMVVRTGAPARPRGAGVFTLAPKQELFSFRPDTGRFLQLTAEDGRVLAHVRDASGRWILYLRADKLVRTAEGRAKLRGAVLRVLDLSSMTVGPEAVLSGDVEALELGFSGATPWAHVWTDRHFKPYLKIDGERLIPMPGFRKRARDPRIRLDMDSGVTGAPLNASPTAGTSCAFRAFDGRTRGSTPTVRLQPAAAPGFDLPAPHGMSLYGLLPP